MRQMRKELGRKLTPEEKKNIQIDSSKRLERLKRQQDRAKRSLQQNLREIQTISFNRTNAIKKVQERVAVGKEYDDLAQSFSRDLKNVYSRDANKEINQMYRMLNRSPNEDIKQMQQNIQKEFNQKRIDKDQEMGWER